MLSNSRLHQHDSAAADLKTVWLPAVTDTVVRADSVTSDDDDNHTSSVVHHIHTDKSDNDTLALDRDQETYSRKTSYAGFGGTTIYSRRDISAGLMTNRHASKAQSVISRRETVHGFSTSTSAITSHHIHNHPLYDTGALWKHDSVESLSFSIELDAHVQRALDRYGRSVGSPLEFKRSVTSKDFLAMVTNERLRYMPEKGSRLDKILKKAESFGAKFDRIMISMKKLDMHTYESPALVLSSCKTLLGLAGRYSYAVERFFTALDEATAAIVVMAEKLDAERHRHHHASHHRVCNIFQATLAMVVDLVVDITASFGLYKTAVGISERTIVAQFESRFEVVLLRLTQLRAEFYLQSMIHWCDHGESLSTEQLLVLLEGFSDFGLDTCPPAYLHVLIKVCLSIQEQGEHVETLRWFRLLWNSMEKHRHECEISHEQIFEVYQEYLVILGLHEEFSERLLVAEEFQAAVLAELGAKSLLYIRVRIEFAKILELDELRYLEAVSIYEELSHFDFHGFDEECREQFFALIEITKYRLTILFESHPDLGHRAEVLLIETFTSLKIKYSYSDERVLVALMRIIDYHRKQKRLGSTSAAIKVIEEYILGLLVEERKDTILFDLARSLAKTYRELASAEIGIKFIQHIKEQVMSGEHAVIEGHCGFGHGQIAHLDRRCFVFIHAFEQFLCGYDREKMLDEIIRDIYTETCLYEAWSVSVRQSNRSIHVRLAAGARLVAYLEQKGRQAEMRQLRTEMWEIFKAFVPASIGTESLWQLFELTVANIHKKTVSIGLLESLVEVSLSVCTAKARDYAVALQLLRWSQIYFRQLTKAEHSKAVALAFRISESLSRRHHIVSDEIYLELHTISSEILVEVLKVGHVDIDLGTIPFAQLNVIIRLLGERKNFAMLERILQYLWDTRMARNWSGTATVATGRRLCEVKFAAGHHAAALALTESICYNLRDVYGSLHPLTVECETLRASFHNTCGDHRAARDIHVHLLEQIGKVDTKNSYDHDHLSGVIMDQAKRLRWAYHQKGDHEKEETFFQSLLHRASDHLHGYGGYDKSEIREVLAVGGEKRETEWTLPQDWSLPVDEVC